MDGPFARVQAHLEGIKTEIADFLEQRQDGAPKYEIEEALGLRADRHGEQGGWLAWSILSLMMNSGEVTYDKPSRRYRKARGA